MKSKTYVICWDGSIKNCLEIDGQLAGSGLDYLIYNVANQDVDRPNWLRAEDIRYYGHFYNALKDFANTDYDVFIFNAGDPVYSNWIYYTKRVEKLMSMDPDIYAIAPNTINDIFSGNGSFIAQSTIFKDLNLSSHTNGIHVSLSRELTLLLKDYMDWAVESEILLIPKMTSGWGIDTILCAIAVYKNKKIYRDVSLNVFHPTTTSTADPVGNEEVTIVLNSFKQFCNIKGLDVSKIEKIYEIAYRKVRERANYNIELREFYTNLEGELYV